MSPLLLVDSILLFSSHDFHPPSSLSFSIILRQVPFSLRIYQWPTLSHCHFFHKKQLLGSLDWLSLHNFKEAFLWEWVISRLPNPQPGGAGDHTSSGFYPLTCLARVTLPGVNTPADIALGDD